MAKKKPITIISPNIQSVVNYESLINMTGKKVFSKSGEYVGKIIDILYYNNMVAGLLVKKGFTRIFVDKSYFDKSPDEVLFLKIDPVILLKGKQVFDSKGRELGKVSAVKRNSSANNFESLIVKKNIFSKPLEIKKENIATMKKNILLNTSQ